MGSPRYGSTVYGAKVGIAPLSSGVLALVEPVAPRDRNCILLGGDSYDPPRPLQPLTSEHMGGEPVGREATNALARELLESYGSELENWVPHLVRGVSAELGLPEVPIEHEWPVDIVAVDPGERSADPVPGPPHRPGSRPRS